MVLAVNICTLVHNVWSAGFDLPCSGDGRIPHHYDVIRLHKPIRFMPIPPALHWNLKMPTNVPVDDGGDLIVSISVVRRCHCTTACHNVVDCLQACTAHAESGTDISMQDVALVVPSPKSLVLSSHHQSLSRTRKVRSLQPTKGLFRINGRLLSETAILTVHRFPFKQFVDQKVILCTKGALLTTLLLRSHEISLTQVPFNPLFDN